MVVAAAAPIATLRHASRAVWIDSACSRWLFHSAVAPGGIVRSSRRAMRKSRSLVPIMSAENTDPPIPAGPIQRWLEPGDTADVATGTGAGGAIAPGRRA